MIVAIDFDGTLHTGQYPAIGSEAPYAAEMMRKLRSDGHYLIINTCRSGEMLVNAVNWLLRHDIPFDRVNDNCPVSTAKYGSNSRKIYAHVYVDDKQIGGLPTWPEIYNYISEKEQQYTRSTSGV
ncbi:MAG: hypothetical protein P1P63_04855 [Treponemataceae bacterium]